MLNLLSRSRTGLIPTSPDLRSGGVARRRQAAKQSTVQARPDHVEFRVGRHDEGIAPRITMQPTPHDQLAGTHLSLEEARKLANHAAVPSFILAKLQAAYPDDVDLANTIALHPNAPQQPTR